MYLYSLIILEHFPGEDLFINVLYALLISVFIMVIQQFKNKFNLRLWKILFQTTFSGKILFFINCNSDSIFHYNFTNRNFTNVQNFSTKNLRSPKIIIHLYVTCRNLFQLNILILPKITGLKLYIKITCTILFFKILYLYNNFHLPRNFWFSYLSMNKIF